MRRQNLLLRGTAALLSTGLYLLPAAAQTVVPVAAGSYASTPPAGEGDGVTDMLTREIYVTGTNRPIPTNDWWTDLVMSQYAGTMWAHPLAISANNQGVNVYYPTTFNATGNTMVTASPLRITGEVLPNPAPTDILLADFEGTTYPAGWTTTGAAFGTGPAAGTLSGQSAVSGYLGAKLANSFRPNDGATGTLTSPDFTVSQNFMHFLVGGGNHPGVAEVQLLVGGIVVQTATGVNSEALKWTTWDLTNWNGQTAKIRIIDNATGGWGHILADHFFLSAEGTDPAAKFDTKFTPADARAKEWSDWHVQFRMAQDANRFMDVTMGHGFPFAWAEFTGVKPQVKSSTAARYFNAGGTITTFPVTADRIGIEYDGRLYGVYAPDATQFGKTGDTLTTEMPAGPRYLVVGALKTEADLDAIAAYAFAVPRDTRMDWTFNKPQAKVSTTWTITAQPLKGSATTVLQGWIPHHYRTTTNSLVFTGHEYLTPRGKLKLAAGNSFTIDFPFRGVLPTLPAPKPQGLPNDYDPERMGIYSSLYSTRTDYGAETYFGGKNLTQWGSYMNFAWEMGRMKDFNKMKQSLKTALTDWFTYTPGETEHYFARYPNWRALVGFNESFYSYQFTDHHFHYGYFTTATALLGMHDPQFLADYGPMAKQVAKEYANWDRNDTEYPFLRTFDIWNGHSYAGGTSSPGGNNQESSSEAMQSWGGLFLLGTTLGDEQITSTGAMGYAMEALAIEEYWNNYHGWKDGLEQGNFTAEYAAQQTITGILFDSGQAYATYFSGDPGWIYGIQWLPMAPMMNYLVRDPEFAEYQYDEMMERRTAFNLAEDPPKPNTSSEMGTALGQVILGYRQMWDPAGVAAEMDALWADNDAVATDNDTPGMTYYFTHINRELGQVDWAYTSDMPTSQTYFNPTTGIRTFIAYNPEATHKLATFYQNGTAAGTMLVPPRTLARTHALMNAGSSFAVLGHTPETGGQQIPATLTQVAVAFSKNVDASTLAGAAITGQGATGLTYASGGGTPVIVFNITGTLQAGEAYQVNLPATIATTEGGATLGTAHSFSFTTSPPDTTIGADGSYLSARYALDEASGTVAADASTNHLDGTYKNSPLLGQPGATPGTNTAITLDGVDDYVQLPRTYELDILGDFTISAWIKPSAVNGDRTIIGTDGYGPQKGLHLLVQGGKPYFGFYGDDTAGTRTISTGVWQHLVFRFHAGEQAIFVNGTLDVATQGHDPFAGLAPLLIGRWGGDSGTPKLFAGSIDDVQVYRRALTDDEIAALHATPGSVNTAGPQNFPPVVNAGPGQTLDYPATVTLSGSVSDDGTPANPGTVTSLWSKVSGPGTVTFANPASPQTTATFSAAGPYVLRLTATDGELTRQSDVTIVFLTGDLVARYTLNETTGTVCNDSSGNEVHGTYATGQTLGAAGAAAATGTAVEFNGSQVVSLGTPALLNGLVNNFTVATWIRPTNVGGTRIIFGSHWQNNNGWSLRLLGGKLALERLGPNFTYNSNASIAANVWTHVAASYGTDNSVTFFVNGASVATVSGTAAAAPATRPWFIGGNGGENTIGRIDDVQVYRRALTATEVAYLNSNPGQTIQPGSPFQTWQTTNGLSGSVPAMDDSDRDGIPLILEYALGGVPTQSSQAPLPRGTNSGGKLALAFTRDTGNTDLILTVQASSTLTGDWTDLARSMNGAAFTTLVSGVSVAETGTGTTREITVSSPDTIGDPARPKRFLRLHLVKP